MKTHEKVATTTAPTAITTTTVTTATTTTVTTTVTTPTITTTITTTFQIVFIGVYCVKSVFICLFTFGASVLCL